MEQLWDTSDGGMLKLPLKDALPTLAQPRKDDQSPYLRAVRTGFHCGQLLLTNGPMLGVEVKQFIRRKAAIATSNFERQGLLNSFSVRLKMAKEMVHEEKFYMPHNIDFRCGRALFCCTVVWGGFEVLAVSETP